MCSEHGHHYSHSSCRANRVMQQPPSNCVVVWHGLLRAHKTNHTADQSTRQHWLAFRLSAYTASFPCHFNFPHPMAALLLAGQLTVLRHTSVSIITHKASKASTDGRVRQGWRPQTSPPAGQLESTGGPVTLSTYRARIGLTR
jgi:hypothetical protein